MKLANANAIRASVVENLFVHMRDYCGEDCGLIASNSFNFPVVTEDGEEGWVEVVVKIPKEEGDEGFDKREEYSLKLAANAEKAKAKAEAKAKKIAKDKERKAKAKAEK